MFNRTITAGLLAAAAAITPLRADVSQCVVDLRNSECKYALCAYDSDGVTRLTRGADCTATINTSIHNLSFTPDSTSFPDGFCGVAHQYGYSQRTTTASPIFSDASGQLTFMQAAGSSCISTTSGAPVTLVSDERPWA